MSNLTQQAVNLAQAIGESSSTQLHPLGELAVTNDGRKFRYAKNGAVATVAGSLYMSKVAVAHHTNMAVATTAAGSKTVSVTLGATAVTANEYRGGYLVINAGTGVGYTYRIASHPAADASTAVVLTLEDPIAVATAVADSKGSLAYHPYEGVIASVDTSKPIGVANYVIPANYYGWFQTAGVCAGLNKSNTAVNLGLASSATSGAFQTVAATTTQIASALIAGADGECRQIFLQLE